MQGELFNFEAKLSSPERGWKERFQVTLRLDHLSILAISALVLYVLIFSFGVETGKRMALEELEAARAKQEELTRGLGGVESSKESPSLPAPPLNVPSIPNEALLPVEPPPPATETPPPPQSEKRYTIQMITFTNPSRAEEELKKFREKGYQSFIIPGGRFFQVCVEAFGSVAEAREKLIQLKAEGFAPSDAFIRPLKGHLPF